MSALQPIPPTRRIRVLIADDHPVIRKVVRLTLEQQPHLEVCGEAVGGAQAVEKAKEIKPDVVVLNVTMPIMDGFAASREIKRHIPETAIVILSSNVDKRFLEEAKRIGARAYVSRSKAGSALVTAIEAALQGEDFIVFGIAGPRVTATDTY
jgi:DNA-binding NarL/FixJ family response regulator